MSSLSFSAATHVGRVRNNNEDSYIARPELGLWLVADGMGGQRSGEVASAIAVQTISGAIADQATLTEAITLAHQAVCRAHDDSSPDMGTTVVALLSRERDYEIAWVGDSRAYLWDLKHLRRLTRDHSMVQEMIDAGVISEREASDHPQRNIITQSVGAPLEPSPKVATLSRQWAPGQSILLCSDGLSGELSDDVISTILADSVSPEDGTRQLLQAALARGGRDNITVLLVNGPPTAPKDRNPALRRLLQRFRKPTLF
jgi:protein phosphatase